MVCLVVSPAPHLWIADQVRNDVTMSCVVFTLCSRVRHWDRLWSSAVKGEGILSVVLAFCHSPPLWFDESLITLCQGVRLQRKGVNVLSFSSRKRPAYAGMTVRGARAWVVRIKICRIMGGLQDWDDADASFSPSPLIPLPSRERGFGCVGLFTRATLWIADQVRNDGARCSVMMGYSGYGDNWWGFFVFGCAFVCE